MSGWNLAGLFLWLSFFSLYSMEESSQPLGREIILSENADDHAVLAVARNIGVGNLTTAEKFKVQTCLIHAQGLENDKKEQELQTMKKELRSMRVRNFRNAVNFTTLGIYVGYFLYWYFGNCQ